MKCRCDIGINVWAKSPAPAGNTTGKETTREYDSLGRLTKNKIVNTGAYTRYEYPTNGIQSKVYSTITDVNNNNTGDTADEVLTETWTDGAGRTREIRTEHPGSTGGYASTLVEYDIMDRVDRSSVPTEVSSSGNPAGDDLTRGFLWTENEYDWKGRTTRTINTDGTDKLYSYDGCGCAGGQVTTVKGEEIIETDWQGNNPNNLGRRTQKVYADILGRAYKTQVMEWNGTTPYTTTVNTFNGRDQVTNTKVYAGDTNSSTYQEATSTFDGHGRLASRHLPQMNTGANATYNYNDDDSIQKMTDARGAESIYLYNSRGLVTQISHTVPTGVAATPNVSYIYDNLGNRTSATDGMGSTTYTYNQLSQMTSETRSFTDSLPNAPIAGNKFKLTYTYTLSGQLKSIEDPFQDKINYTHDKLGRLTSVDGATAFDGVTNYADTPHYRAWGALQSLEYSNGLKMEMTFNNRLQADTFKLTNPTVSETYMDKEYDYYSDGKLRKLDDKMTYSSLDGMQDSFDRLTTYDHVGRPKLGLSGEEARGGTVAQADKENKLPYHQSYSFNAFNNMTQRTNEHWGKTSWNGENFDLNYTYQNNRITNSYWLYDADGRVIKTAAPEDIIETEYDAKGQISRLYKASSSDVNRYYDASGGEVKRNQKTYTLDQNNNGSWNDDIEYFIRSSVLGGQVVTKVSDTGRKTRTYVRAAGTVLAWQNQGFYNNTETEYVNFQYGDASGLSERSGNKNGNVFGSYEGEGEAVERDPMGGNVRTFNAYFTFNQNPPEPESPLLLPMNEFSQNSSNPNAVTYVLDGMEVPQSVAHSALRSGAAEIDRYRTSERALSRSGIYAPVPDSGGDACVNGVCPDGNIVEVNGSSSYVWIPNAITNWNPDTIEPVGGGENGSSDDGMNKCERYLAKLFANASASFSDVTDGNGIDVFTRQDHTPFGEMDGEHNHLYDLSGEKKAFNDPNGVVDTVIFNPTPLYAPSGFIVLAQDIHKKRNESVGQKYLTLYYPELNGYKDVILQLWHVEGEIGEQQSDGRTKIGRLGENGIYTSNGIMPFTQTWHMHINAYKWWGRKDKNGKPIGNALGGIKEKRMNRIKLSDLFCKNL